MQSLGTLEMVSLHWLTFVKPHTDEKIIYNSGRIFTIRATAMEKNAQICILKLYIRI